jgi:protein-disulfide isomerase
MSGAVATGDTAAAATGTASFDMPEGPAEGGRKVIEKPTAADLAVAGPLGDRVLGSPSAPLTVYEFASLTCPYCRAFHASTFPQVRKQYIDTGKIRWVLREFPIGRSSGTAWIVTRCMPEQKQLALYERFLAEQASWVSQEVRPDAIFAVAAKEGMTRGEFDNCLANQSIEQGLAWVKERGRTLGVSGTPTFFFGEQKFRSNMTFDEFKAIVDPMLAGGKVASTG